MLKGHLARVRRGIGTKKIRKVDVRLPEKGTSNSHGARLVHLIITMIKWIRTSRKKSLCSGTLYKPKRGRNCYKPKMPQHRPRILQDKLFLKPKFARMADS